MRSRQAQVPASSLSSRRARAPRAPELGPVRHDILQQHASVRADAVKWDAPVIEQPDQVGTRDVQQLGRFLCRQLRVVRDETYRLTARHLARMTTSRRHAAVGMVTVSLAPSGSTTRSCMVPFALASWGARRRAGSHATKALASLGVIGSVGSKAWVVMVLRFSSEPKEPINEITAIQAQYSQPLPCLLWGCHGARTPQGRCAPPLAVV